MNHAPRSTGRPRDARAAAAASFCFSPIFAVLFGGGTALSYYVDALWFGSLGYAAVFWKTLNLQGAVFTGFAAVTFLILYGSFLALKPADLAEIAGGAIVINGQPVKLPVEPVLRLIALGVSLAIAAATGAGMMAEWPTLALYWYGAPEHLPAAAHASGRRSDLRPAAPLLSVHAAGVAARQPAG